MSANFVDETVTEGLTAGCPVGAGSGAAGGGALVSGCTELERDDSEEFFSDDILAVEERRKQGRGWGPQSSRAAQEERR